MPSQVKFSLCGICCLLILLTLICSADPGIMVIRIEGDKIVLNRGSNDGIKPDQELYAHRIGKPVGMLKVTLVDTYSSEAVITRLEPEQTVRVGDVVTFEPFSIAYTPPPPRMPEPESSKKPVPVNNDYLNKLKDHIKVATFKSGPKGTVRVGLGEASLLLNAIGWGSYIPYSDPWMLITVGGSLYQGYATQRKTGTHLKTTVAVCYYDDDLIEAQARYFASKEGITDEAQIMEVKKGIVEQMSADMFLVFHVKIHNGGEDVVQLAPIKWHIYVIDPMGEKVSASRYDEALDKGLGPNQETQGYLFFPKYGETGATNAGTPMRVRLESILGGNADLSWR
jgi:hypothetical protein